MYRTQYTHQCHNTLCWCNSHLTYLIQVQSKNFNLINQIATKYNVFIRAVAIETNIIRKIILDLAANYIYNCLIVGRSYDRGIFQNIRVTTATSWKYSFRHSSMSSTWLEKFHETVWLRNNSFILMTISRSLQFPYFL